jgi:hypothetical protein
VRLVLMQDIEVKVYRSSLKIPVAFFVPGAFLVTVYALTYLFLNSNIFLNALLGKLDEVFPGSVQATELVISPTLTAAHVYDAHIYSPEDVEVIRAEEAHVKLAPLLLLARRIEIYDAVVRRGGVRMTLPEHSEETFDLLRALGVDKPKDPNDTSEPLIRQIAFRNVRCEECFYSIDLGFFRADIPVVTIPNASVEIGETLSISVPALDVAALDLTFQAYLFGFPEDQGPWKFRGENIAIRHWQWSNEGFTVERVSLMADGVTASATGDMRFPDTKHPDDPTQMLYRAGGSIHIPVNTKLGDYFLDEVFHADVDANISVRGTLDDIEGVFVAEAPYLETQKVKFQYLQARGFLLDDVVFIEHAVADLHGGTVDLRHGIFSMFEGIYAAQATFEGVDPEGVLGDLEFDYPWMSGAARGEVTMMGWIPKSPEWEKPGDDPFARINEATKPVSWIHLDSDATIVRNSREVLPGGRIRLLEGGEVATSLETAHVSDITAVFDHITARISNFHFNWIQNVLHPGLRGSAALARLSTNNLGGLGLDYGVKGLTGGMEAEINALGLMNFPKVDGDLRLKSPSITLDGTTIASGDLSTRFRIREGRLEFTPVQVNTASGNLRLGGSLAILRDPHGVIDPLTGRQTSEFLGARNDNAKVDFEVAGMNMALADRFLKSGMELRGSIDAAGVLTGNLSDPVVAVDAALSNGQAVGQEFNRVAFEGVFSRRNIEAHRFEADAGDAGRVNGRGAYDVRADTFDFALSGEDVVFERLSPLLAMSPVPIEGTSQLELHGTGSLAQPQIGGYVLVDGLGIDGRKLGGGSVVVNTLGTTVHVVGAFPSLATVALELPLDAESPFYARLGLDHLDLHAALDELRDSQLVERLDVTGTVETFVDRDFSRYQVLVTLDEFLLDTLSRRFTNRGPIIAGLNDGNLIQIQQAEVGAQGRYVMIQGGIFLDEALLDISLAGSLDMALLNSFRASFPEYFPDTIIDARGVVELDTNVRGTPGGTLVADGFLKFLPTEIQLRDLPEPVLINSGLIRFSRDGLNIDDEAPIRGRALQGIFELGGSLGLAGFEARDLVLNLQAVNMSYRIPDVANLTFGGNLTLNAPSIDRPDTWKVTGLVDVVDGLYYENISIFQEQFTNRILGAFSRQSDAYQASLVERFPILEEVNFDLNIRARDSFRIQSEIDRLGLDLELRIDVRLQNTLALPRIVGDVDVIDGRVKFQDEKFEVSSGTLTFSGEAKNPYVDIVADSEVSNRCRKTDLGDDTLTSFNLSGDSSSVEQQIFRIILNVQGRLSNLDIQLESNPFADQRDILSLILTGCTVDQITASSASSPTLEVALAPVLGWIEGTVQDAVAVEEFTITPSVDRLRTSVGDRISRRLSWRLQVDTGLADTSSGQLYQLNYKLSDAWAAELSESTKTDDNSFVIDFKLKYRLFLD